MHSRGRCVLYDLRPVLCIWWLLCFFVRWQTFIASMYIVGCRLFLPFSYIFLYRFFFVTSVEWFFTVPTPAYGIDGQEVMWGHTTVGGQEHDSMWKLSYKLKYLAADERLYTGKEHQRSRHFAQEAWKRHSKLGKSKQKSWQIPVWLLYFKTLGFMTQKHLSQVAPHPYHMLF